MNYERTLALAGGGLCMFVPRPAVCVENTKDVWESIGVLSPWFRSFRAALLLLCLRMALIFDVS